MALQQPDIYSVFLLVQLARNVEDQVVDEEDQKDKSISREQQNSVSGHENDNSIHKR